MAVAVAAASSVAAVTTAKAAADELGNHSYPALVCMCNLAVICNTGVGKYGCLGQPRCSLLLPSLAVLSPKCVSRREEGDDCYLTDLLLSVLLLLLLLSTVVVVFVAALLLLLLRVKVKSQKTYYIQQPS